MTISECVSSRIREILSDKNMTIYKLEQLSCVSHSTMKCLLNNVYDACNLRTLFQITDALDMSVVDFFDSDLFNLETIDYL